MAQVSSAIWKGLTPPWPQLWAVGPRRPHAEAALLLQEYKGRREPGRLWLLRGLWRGDARGLELPESRVESMTVSTQPASSLCRREGSPGSCRAPPSGSLPVPLTGMSPRGRLRACSVLALLLRAPGLPWGSLVSSQLERLACLVVWLKRLP